MERWRWALVALVLLTVVLVAWAIASRRRKLKDTDTPIDLRDRPRPVEFVDLRDLAPPMRTRYVEEWIAIQERYVEDPVRAVLDADSLLSRVLADRGYPGDRDAHIDLTAVDHPRLAESLHAVSVVRHRAGGGLTSFEDLREVMVHYRVVFVELLAENGSAARNGVPRDATASRD